MARKPVPEVTETGQRFQIPLFLRIDDLTGVPIPSETEQVADYKFSITVEYPTYEEELQIKKVCQVSDDYGYRFDYEKFVEERVRRCLIKWDLHEKIPNFTDKLFRVRNVLTDESLELWKKLPPLVRKYISETIGIYMGAP